MLDHVIVLEQIEMFDDVIVGQQADVRAAQLLLQLELIDSRRLRTSRPAMYHDRDREHRDRRRAHRHRRPAERRQPKVLSPPSPPPANSRAPGLPRAQLAFKLGAILGPIRFAHFINDSRKIRQYRRRRISRLTALRASLQMCPDARALVRAQLSAQIRNDFGLWMNAGHSTQSSILK